MTLQHRMRAPLLAAVVVGFALTSAQAASPEVVKMISSNCQQCHEIKGIGDFGNVGPSLVGLKERFPDRKDVAAIIYDETKRNPLTAMPPFGRNLILDKQQIDTIVDYLYNQ